MSNLFERPHAGWRYQPELPKMGLKKQAAELQKRLEQLRLLAPHDDERVTQQRKTQQVLAASQLKRVNSYKSKRSPKTLRRSNPKSLAHVLEMMKVLCLETAKTRKLDTTKNYWFLKAELASKLQVPEHFVAQAMHKWNLAGISSQGENVGVHDTHRGGFWGGPWVSSWQDTRYTINLAKLAALVD